MVASRSSLALFALALLLTGCGDLAQHRLRWIDDSKGPPPQPAPTLKIPDPPPLPPPSVAKEPEPTPPQASSQAPPQAPPQASPVVQAKAEVRAASSPRALYENAVKRYQMMDSYTMRLRRREVVNGKQRPEELMLCKFRQEPFSVYFKWLGPEAKGREAVYVKGRPGNEIHTLTAAGDVPLMPGGQRFSISADSVMVKSKSRYPITEAGLGNSIRKFGAIALAVEKGDSRLGTLKLLGPVKRPEFEELLEGVEQAVPQNSDPLLPSGGRRWWFFDPMGLPALIITHDETGREVEYYCHDRIQAPVRLDDDDFNPDKLWRKKDLP
jgi:hypothetical protein